MSDSADCGTPRTTLRQRLYVALVEQRVIDSQHYGEAPYAPITWELVDDILSPGSPTLEGESRPICLRCEVPIYQDEGGVWRREVTGSQVCPRNPAVDGHEPLPTYVTPSERGEGSS